MDKLQAAMEKTLKENFSVVQSSFHHIPHSRSKISKTLHLDSPHSVSQDFGDSQDKAQGQRDEKTQRSESEIW